MAYSYPYPRPLVTVDVFLLRLNGPEVEVLLVERKRPPFQGRWALPGGFIEMDEPLIASARRELSEETGLRGLPLLELAVFGDPGRDPRDRTVTIVFAGALPLDQSPAVAGGDDARQARWFGLSQLPALAFDHGQIVRTCLERFRFNLIFSAWWSLFLPAEFSAELPQRVFQAFQLPPWLSTVALHSLTHAGLLVETGGRYRIQGDVAQFLAQLPSSWWLQFWLEQLGKTPR
ncbi:MAG: NUDIX hydrolase [Calditrichaeota bacterium]|nr:MAG: NUDIX hydrolase [Calditrichota bacterium]